MLIESDTVILKAGENMEVVDIFGLIFGIE